MLAPKITEQTICIIIVDDNESDSVILRHKIKSIDGFEFSFVFANNYNDALDKISADEFDVAFFDYDLGGDDNGIKLLTEMRGRNIQVPVIMLTGVDDATLEQEAKDAGVFRFFNKAEFVCEKSDVLNLTIGGAIASRFNN